MGIFVLAWALGLGLSLPLAVGFGWLMAARGWAGTPLRAFLVSIAGGTVLSSSVIWLAWWASVSA